MWVLETCLWMTAPFTIKLVEKYNKAPSINYYRYITNTCQQSEDKAKPVLASSSRFFMHLHFINVNWHDSETARGEPTICSLWYPKILCKLLSVFCYTPWMFKDFFLNLLSPSNRSKVKRGTKHQAWGQQNGVAMERSKGHFRAERNPRSWKYPNYIRAAYNGEWLHLVRLIRVH